MNFGLEPASDENSVIIDLTSLIDVLFVLLLFFMVTTTFSDTNALMVKLPSAASGTPQAVKKDLSVTITKKGEIFLDGRAMNRQQLAAEFVKLKQPGSDLALVVQADTSVDHGTVVGVLDDAKTNGIDKIAIATTAPVQ